MCAEPSFFDAVTSVGTGLAALAAVFSGICAFYSYRLSQKIRDEWKTDEQLVLGTPIQPNLQIQEHRQSVVQLSAFNRSKRKCYISAVRASGRDGSPIEITWSDAIDDYGNVLNPTNLVGVVDSTPVYLRRNDGKSIDYALIEVRCSFHDGWTSVVFEPDAAFIA